MTDSHKFIPYGRQTVTQADIDAVINVMKSEYLTQGPMVPCFENAVAKKVNVKHGIVTNSATSALHIACIALGLRPGDRLWTSPITFVASANSARYCGAEVDFVDIEPKTGLMCTERLEKKLEIASKEGKLPKVVMPVHLCGTSCAMQTIRGLADKYGFKVLEDASHAIGGKYQQQPIGSCQYSEISVFSFHPVKIITTGEGGIATTNDRLLARRMSDLRCHGITKDSTRFEQATPGPWSYEQQELGFNYRMNEMQAALGLSQLQRIEAIIAERQRLHERYKALLANLPVQLLHVPADVSSSLHLAVIRLKNSTKQHHKFVFEKLRAANIGVQLHYTPVHLQPYYRRLGFKINDFPNAEEYATNAISLPIYPGLNEHDLKYIVDTLTSILKS